MRERNKDGGVNGSRRNTSITESSRRSNAVDCLDLSGGLSERRVNFVSHRHKKDTKEINYKKVGQ